MPGDQVLGRSSRYGDRLRHRRPSNPGSNPGVGKITLRPPNVRIGPGPNQLLIQWVQATTIPGGELPGSETEHSHLVPRPSWRPQRQRYLQATQSTA
jgi:hypothetical protein